ncbi:MAG: histidine phosphatase family protein, partial [Planctomycetaceae bacterium]|nr:histidine phosphatase family protein [Planctomycetaceae bacterium]
GRVQGSLNLPLTPRGIEQVEDIVSLLRETELSAIYASPTEPALSTAERIATGLHLPLKIKDDLANLDFGLWQGLSVTEIRHRQPRVLRQWEEAPASVCPPQGETWDHAWRRVEHALHKPIRRGQDFAVVVPEPLATLVTCLLYGAESAIDCPLSGHLGEGRVEEITARCGESKVPIWSWTRHEVRESRK